jgi:phosphate transport system permease protein
MTSRVYGGSVRWRRFKDRLMFYLAALCVVLAVIPLFSILIEVFRNGAAALTLEFLTSLPGPVGEPGGGVANAIQGTLILIGLTSLIGVPLGVLTGVYLAEFGDNRYAQFIRFLSDVLAGLPSIVIGIFAYSAVVVTLGSYSALAGAFSLAIIMLPVVSRTTEEAVRLVPHTIREAAMALGIPRWKTIIRIVLATARGGILTGVMLAVARIAGETAPLIMTILGSQWWFAGLDHPMDALPLRIWRLALQPYEYAHLQGWGSALLLILLVLSLNVVVRLATRGRVLRPG